MEGATESLAGKLRTAGEGREQSGAGQEGLEFGVRGSARPCEDPSELERCCPGTGKDDVAEMTDTFRSFYESKGIHIPSEPTYTDRDTEILANAEATDIIKAGFEEVVEEVDRLADIGVENMSAREKAVFAKLAEYRQSTERSNELSSIGVKEDVYNSKEFNDFASKFGSNTSITEIYEIYNKMQPKKDIRTMGSLKTNAQQDNGVKEFYSLEEARKFTKEDFDKNPELFKAVEKSMLKWKH